MIEQFTKTFGEFVLSYEGWETEFSPLLAKFPKFVFNDEDLDIDLEFEFKSLFYDKYDLREIGAESDTLFAHFLRENLKRSIITYVPKIAIWLKNFNGLYNNYITLSHIENESVGEINQDKHTGTDSSSLDTSSKNDSQNTYYLNPSSSNTGYTRTLNPDGSITISGGNLKTDKLDDVIENNDSSSSGSTTYNNTMDSTKNKTGNRTISSDRILASYSKVELLEQIMKLKNIYLEAVDSFDKCFMGLY